MKIENLCMKCMREKESPEAVCEHCGFDPAEQMVPPHHLQPFSILAGKYLVGNAIGEGGFGITYIGMDLNLEMRVAIKEYYPNGCAIREGNGSSTVQSYTGEQQQFFEIGREKFINEAKILAKCINLPEIVTVKDFFKENHTAYIVMEYIDGKTLKEYLKEKGGRLSVEETLKMMRPVIKSLGEVHKMNLIHRDISPDNIMIKKDGSVKVLDFGGARDFGSAGKSMSIMLKPGYAPEEQYRTHGEQGPWTDIYALCATIYRCITGEIPPESMERTYRDDMKPLSAFGIACPPNVEYTLKKGLSIYKDGRFSSMEELYWHLYGPETGTGAVPEPRSIPGTGGRVVPEPLPEPETESGSSVLKYVAISLGVFAAALIILVVIKMGLPFGGSKSEKTKENNKVVAEETKPEETKAKEKEETKKDTKEEKKKDTKTDDKKEKEKERKKATPTPTPKSAPVVENIDLNVLQSYLNGHGSGSNQCMYVYDLAQDSGKGTGNSDQKYPPSAVITIPILYTAARQMDSGLLSMDTPVRFEYTYSGGRGTLGASQNGANVTVRELLENMLQYSDNNAINTMINVLTLGNINSTCNNAGYSSVELNRKIVSNANGVHNYMSAKDAALMLRDLYNGTFKSIGKDYILANMKIIDTAGRLGIFRSDELYNNGIFCSQNGIVPKESGGTFVEIGIVFADEKEYIISAFSDGGNANLSAQEFSEASSYIHSCMCQEPGEDNGEAAPSDNGAVAGNEPQQILYDNVESLEAKKKS